MNQLFVSLLMLCGLTAAAGAQAPGPQTEAERARLLGALYRLEKASARLLSGGLTERELDERLAPLAADPPAGDFAGLERSLARAVRENWREWKRTRSPAAQDKYLDSLEQATLFYTPELSDHPRAVLLQADRQRQAVLKDLQQLEKRTPERGGAQQPAAAGGGAAPDVKAVAEMRATLTQLQRVRSDLLWIGSNLKDVSVTGEGRKGLQALAQALHLYSVTRDPELLEATAADLRVKVEHCEKTRTRADQPTRFTFETIDERNNPQKDWIVFAMPEKLAPRFRERVGSPSTPVTGHLLPGRYIFFAEREGQRTCAERHTVSEGKIIPEVVLLRECRKP